jgi:hypothetical protein
MERYASFVGKRVEAHYRSADIHLFAVGVIVADNGKAVFLEDRFASGGKEKTIRLEIPYTHIVRVVELAATAEPTALSALRAPLK